MIVYDERMKSSKHARIFSIIYICLCFFIVIPTVFAQESINSLENKAGNIMRKLSSVEPTTDELTSEEFNAFLTTGYILRTHLPYEAYNRIILGKISPLHAGFSDEVHFEAHNDLHGKFTVSVKQRDTFRSIDGQRLLDVKCCSELYTSNLAYIQTDFSDGINKTFRLPKLDKKIEGTFNDVMNIYVFPDY